MPIPKRIILIGVLLCFVGIRSLFHVIADAFSAKLNLEFTVFLLPVGIGILRGRRRSQWWTRFWIILGYLFCAFLIGVCVVSPNSTKASYFGHEITGPDAVPYMIAASVALAATLIVFHRLLYSQKACEYLQR